MAKSIQRNLTVIKTVDISPNMKRITLGGEDMHSFPASQQSAYLKLLFPREGGDLNSKPLMRTYTVRNHHNSAREIDVDFVIHGDIGPASQWANYAKIGDVIKVSGPGPRKLVDLNADWYLFAGDMTALPAISVNLEQLPSHAKGFVVLEILEENDKQTLSTPENMNIIWVVKTHGEPHGESFLRQVKALEFMQGEPSVWVACEFSVMRKLRQYFRNEKMLSRERVYISSYWKSGLNEDEHKKVKSVDNIEADKT